MASLLPPIGPQRDAENDAGTTGRESDRRTALLGVGAFAAGYLVGRRLLGTGGPSTGGLLERVEEGLPGDGVDVSIGGTDVGAEMAGADPTLEEVDERSEPDVKAEPAEPGETQIDEGWVEEDADGNETET